MSEPTKEALELAEYLEDFSARVLLHGVSPASVQSHYDKCHAAAQLLRNHASLREELRAAREASKERDAAFLYIRTLWRNNQLPAAMDNYLFNALTKKTEAQP